MSIHEFLIISELTDTVLYIPHIVYPRLLHILPHCCRQYIVTVDVAASSADGVDLVVTQSTYFELFLLLVTAN